MKAKKKGALAGGNNFGDKHIMGGCIRSRGGVRDPLGEARDGRVLALA